MNSHISSQPLQSQIEPTSTMSKMSPSLWRRVRCTRGSGRSSKYVSQVGRAIASAKTRPKPPWMQLTDCSSSIDPTK